MGLSGVTGGGGMHSVQPQTDEQVKNSRVNVMVQTAVVQHLMNTADMADDINRSSSRMTDADKAKYSTQDKAREEVFFDGNVWRVKVASKGDSDAL